MAQTDRFDMKEIKRKLEKQKNDTKKDGKEKGSKNEMKSSKFFKRLQDVAKTDKERKDTKKRAKKEGGDVMLNMHNNQSAKRFKL